MEKFVAALSAEGVFARRVNSSGVAFHSKYIAAAAPLLRRSLERVITDPKPRSSRWISSSLPKDQWDSDLGESSPPPRLRLRTRRDETSLTTTLAFQPS